MAIPEKASGVPDTSDPKKGPAPKDEEVLAKEKKGVEDEDAEDEDEGEEEEDDEEEGDEEDVEDEDLDEDEEDLEDEDEDELDEDDEELEDEEEDEEEEDEEKKGKDKALPKRRGGMAAGEGGEGPPAKGGGSAPPPAAGAAGAVALTAGAVAVAATPEAKDASAAAKAESSPASGSRPATGRLRAAARAPSARRAAGATDQGTNRIKLVALGVCFLLFLACLGVGGWAIYMQYFYKPPEEAKKPPTLISINYSEDIKNRETEAKNEANAGQDAKEKNDYAASLEHYKKALLLWNTNVEVIQNLRARDDYSGPEYAPWERVAANDNMFILAAKEEIFRLELTISREKVEKERKAKKEEDSVLKEGEYDEVPVDDPSYEAQYGKKRTRKVPKAKPTIPEPAPKEEPKAEPIAQPVEKAAEKPAETKAEVPAP
jgi:hypothetical protein